MRMKASLYFAAAALCAGAIATPAFAGDAEGTSVPQESTVAPVKAEKKICKRQTTVGTRLAASICLTRSQWRARDLAIKEHRKEFLDRANRAPVNTVGQGGGG
jgi:hypothetical protein